MIPFDCCENFDLWVHDFSIVTYLDRHVVLLGLADLTIDQLDNVSENSGECLLDVLAML